MVISHGDCPCLPEPANSLLWFEYAAGLGVDALEMDLMLTADGEIITFHDKSWENLSNGTGSVRETTVSYMKKVRRGLGDWRIGFVGNNSNLLSSTPPLLPDPEAY